MEIFLAEPRGFCAGVDRAVQIVEQAIEKFGKPIFVRHEIVHNKYVVNRLQNMGAVFVEEIDEVPKGKTVILSAHGVASSVYSAAEARQLRVIDATCPLVKKVHFSAKRHHESGSHVILIGHSGHAEVIGTLGQLPEGSMHLVATKEDVQQLQVPEGVHLSYITQTTLSVEETRGVIDALRLRFPDIKGPEKGDLCYATTNRQAAVKELCKKVQLLLVVGASNSSNSNRLKELGQEHGVQSYLIAGKEDLQRDWFIGIDSIGISSGASAPEVLVQGVIEELKSWFKVKEVQAVKVMEENVHFRLPAELYSAKS
jgi:4-hydroxy-3-methylbut-2-en-1-yl diphosphate reductase